MKMSKLAAAILLSGSVLTYSGIASAHVTVWPKQTKVNAYERFTVRVPNEKDSNTVKVRLEFPTGMQISSVLPLPGWNYEFEKDSEGRFKAITWTAANGGGIKPNEFMEFGLSGKNPSSPGNVAFKAYQTYANGSVVEWTGDASSKTPAPVITVQAADQTAAGNEGKQEAAADPKKDAAAGTNTAGSNTLPLILSGAALLIAMISLFRKNK